MALQVHDCLFHFIASYLFFALWICRLAQLGRKINEARSYVESVNGYWVGDHTVHRVDHHLVPIPWLDLLFSVAPLSRAIASSVASCSSQVLPLIG